MNNWIDPFRNPAVADVLAGRIGDLGRQLAVRRPGPIRIMEVCGSHTMSIARYGLRDLLPPQVDLVSGPGCPVCVTDTGYLDTAICLARQGVIIATFGDMLNVPGSDTTLGRVRSEGARIEVCYSPSEALAHARQNPGREVVFLAIGFETTIGPVISLIDPARTEGLKNLSLLVAFKRIPPALALLRADPELAIDAFLCPAHVSAIIGAHAYDFLTGPKGIPCVIAGFEPLDILIGIDHILQQKMKGEARVENLYNRVVRENGNLRAQALIDRILEPVSTPWRGLGILPDSGLALRPDYADFDAPRKLGVPLKTGVPPTACRCGDVIKGKLHPPECPLFGLACNPDHPVGPCMVSAEGSCAAAFKYARLALSPSNCVVHQPD
jgi:hydrogenase expression/formation protein HypD